MTQGALFVGRQDDCTYCPLSGTDGCALVVNGPLYSRRFDSPDGTRTAFGCWAVPGGVFDKLADAPFGPADVAAVLSGLVPHVILTAENE